MAFSVPLARTLTSSPHFHNQANKFVITKSSKLSTTSTKTLTYPSPCKPFPHAIAGRSKPSFLSAATDIVSAETTTYTDEEQWKIEREALSQQIESLELKIQQLTSESSSATPPVDGILNEFFNISSRLEKLALSKDGLLIVDPKPNPGPCSETVDEMVKNTFKHYDADGQVDVTEKLKYLGGNFGPVGKETPPTSDIITVEGKIPETLNGMMLRNGPDPKFCPEGNYMWMDGDSMIHGIGFKDGEATYVARYTQTSRYKQQNEFNKSQALMFGDLVGEYGLFTSCVDTLRTRLNVLDKRFGISNANTGLVYHGGRIMALEDFGEPYVIYVDEDGDLKTLGINVYNGKLDHWLSPHPKIDPITGDMFNFGSMTTSPYCIYRVISKEGVISDPVPITVQVPTYNHDLCITENYVIFQDLPYVYDPEKMKKVDKEWIFHFDETKKPRYGILPKYETSEDKIKWFEFDDSFFVFHNANAWEEEDGTIVLYCCNMKAILDTNTGTYSISPAAFQIFEPNFQKSKGHQLMDFNISIPQLYKMTFNMTTNEKPTKELIGTDVKGDYPKINEKYMGRKTRYVYSSEANTANKITSIVKFDLEKKDGNPKKYEFLIKDSPHAYGAEEDSHKPHAYGGEVVFVPKTDSSIDEDDGYLITFVHEEDYEDSVTGTSYVHVIDAKLMELVAKLQLPSRVPYGFHAIYVTEEQLKNQIKPSP